MPNRRVIASTLVAITFAGLLAGCSSNNVRGEPTGSLAVTLKATGAPVAEGLATAAVDHDDAPRRLNGAVVTIAGLEARLADGTWIPVDTGLPVGVDLIALLSAGKAAALPTDSFPEGEYDALQLRITQVQLTLLDATKIAIAPPASGWTVQIPVSFSVVAGGSTTVTLALRCGSSFRSLDGQFAFDPEIELDGIAHD